MFQVSEMVENMFLGLELGEKHEFLCFEPFRTMGISVLGVPEYPKNGSPWGMIISKSGQEQSCRSQKVI